MQAIFALILYAFLFIGVFFVVDAVAGLLRVAQGKDEESVERRLLSPVLSRVQVGGGQYNVVREKSTTWAWASSLPFYAQFSRLLVTSGTGMTFQRAVIAMILIAVLTLLPLAILLPPRFLPLTLIAAPASGVMLVLFYLLRAKSARVAKFEEGLPDAIDLIVRSLKVGHPLSGAMAVVAKELPAPISTEFQIAYDQVSYGQDIPSAFSKMSERVPVADLGYFSMAIQVQQESGGNLVESLAKLSTVIRERFRMFRKVKALTAEGRFSAWFLSIFPFFLIVIITFIKPDYYTSVMDIAIFPQLVAATIILMIVNIIAMRIMTTLKV
ncbi:MAG TPA: type II secretion system F family protein [Micropepsaceae bacterium]|nr:type II secretion system F family protein [Micropepsaceae bacterium]